MTLYRQLIISTFVILFCLCTGLWIGEFTRTRDFLVEQMSTQAQDTSSSLGLSLTAMTDGIDLEIMETMIAALFDRGNYRIIALRDMKGKVLAERRLDTSLESVPPWFISLVPLNVPQAKSLVMHGWQQIGEVMVECHPGYAYRTLWLAVWSTALWFALTGVLCALLGGLALRRLLRPLHKVEEQAVALCDRQFQLQETLPQTRELRSVVIAMNRMTMTIQKMFHEQTAIADNLRELSFQDPLTGLGNRRYIEAQVKAKLNDSEMPAKGALLLFQIQHLQAINEKKGYQEGDRVVKTTADLIRYNCRDLPEVMFGRTGGGDFVVFLPYGDVSLAMRIAEEITDAVRQQIMMEEPSATLWKVLCGGIFFEQAASFGQLMAEADTALSMVRYNDNALVEIRDLHGCDQTISVGIARTEWKSMIEQVVARRSIIFYSQPVVECLDVHKIVHHELLTRLIDSAGQQVHPGIFLPAAERLGMMPALDRLILERIFELPQHIIGQHRMAINLSPLSLADNDFLSWLHLQLERCAEQGVLLNFEFPEFRSIRYSGSIKSFSQTIKRQGHRVGIDHFGQGLFNFGYLQSLLPDYIKIDRGITIDLVNEENDQYFYISTLCNVAHSLNIRVIVEGVENENQWRLLSKMPIDAVQGFYIQPTVPLINEPIDQPPTD